MRVAVVDLGSNSTRLLIADVAADGALSEIVRRSTVTRLGQGVEASGHLASEAMERVCATLADYRELIDAHGANVAVGVLTSAVRDAANGAEFAATVHERFGITARTLAGDEEARLTYLGAVSEDRSIEPTAVIDIGGGSTEVVVGVGGRVRFHVSTQVGVVRHTERHLRTDPPGQDELRALRDDVARTFAEHIPADLHPVRGIAVAGTATQAAAIAGHELLEQSVLAAMLAWLASVDLAQREAIAGLDPERAPTIVAGVVILIEAMRALGLHEVRASHHDILRGAAISHESLGIVPPHFRS